MAKLPDASILGATDPLNSKRPIAALDLGASARGEASGAAAVEQGVQSLAQGVMRVGTTLADVEVMKSNYQRTQANAKFLSDAADLDHEFSTDTKYQDLKPRYEERLGKIREDAAATIENPTRRERFATEVTPAFRHQINKIDARARGLERDANVGYVLETGNKHLDSAVKAPDEETRAQFIQSYHDLVDGLVSQGYRTRVQGLAMKQAWAESYGSATLAKLIDTDPAEAIRRLEAPAGQKGAGGSIYDFLPADKREQLLHHARNGVRVLEQRALQDENKASVDKAEGYELEIINAQAGDGELPLRTDLEGDPGLKPQARNALLRQHDAATAGMRKYQEFAQRFAAPAGAAFNAFDPGDQDGVDKTYKLLGGNDQALSTVVERTGMLPKSVATALRGDLVSSNPARAEAALQTVARLSTKNPTIFAASPGHKDLDDAATAFRHDVEELGMTSPEAARRYVESQSPDYQAKVKARIKGEDLNEIVKKQLSVDDLRGAFDTSWWPGSPAIGFEPESRKAMFADYEELFRERYLETGSEKQAKALAITQLKRTWGVTQVSGSDVVMRYPPDKAPAYANIDNAAERIAAQAVTAIKDEAGQDVDRSQLRLMPVPGGRTSGAFWRGEPPPYLVLWQDKDGVVHSLNPGRAFVADPAAMREQQSKTRGESFAGERAYRDTARPPLPPVMSKERKALQRRREGALPGIAPPAPNIAAPGPEE